MRPRRRSTAASVSVNVHRADSYGNIFDLQRFMIIEVSLENVNIAAVEFSVDLFLRCLPVADNSYHYGVGVFGKLAKEFVLLMRC